ncbi:MAG: rod shape-determining protein RodA [Allosphingosinicella sp.]|uniref:rod shape-determining protein RodA n=1 Tax=Allosphingosinicella sp. TaxID=2823234 RepID=UPI00392BB161
MALAFVPQPIADLPWKMLVIVLSITGFGLLILYSAAGGSLMPWALPQGIRFAVFLAMAIVMSYLTPERFKQGALPAYAVVILMLILVEAIGALGGGAQRWLNLGVIRIQPSELMKPVIVLVVAAFYDRLPVSEIRKWNAIWPPLLLTGFPAALILVQPDLGTALTMVGGAVTVMFLAGLPLRLFLGAAAAAAAVIPFVYTVLLEEYQQRRVTIFLTPEADPLGAGYHITQSKIAIGSGGLFGKGFLKGTQSHLDYLPEGHTDFIFATMAEEWGLIGGIFLIGAFALLLKWGIGVALEAKGRFERLAAAGLTTTIFFYIAINLMMVMGLAPVVGIPLPLVSWGGSAMLTVMICLGILMSIDRVNRKERRPR